MTVERRRAGGVRPGGAPLSTIHSLRSMRAGTIAILLAATVLLVGACGSGSSGATGLGTVSTAARTAAAPDATASTEGEALTSWTEFGLDPQRSDATNRPTGITAANIGRLKDRQIKLPGTIDSSPIYLHGATVGGAGATS